MSSIDFPDSPTIGDTFTVGQVTWQWDGTTWKSIGNAPQQNLDGGKANSQYGGIMAIQGGSAGSF